MYSERIMFENIKHEISEYLKKQLQDNELDDLTLYSEVMNE